MDQKGPKREDDADKSSKPSWWQDDFEDDDSQLKFFGPGSRGSTKSRDAGEFSQGGHRGRQQRNPPQHRQPQHRKPHQRQSPQQRPLLQRPQQNQPQQRHTQKYSQPNQPRPEWSGTPGAFQPKRTFRSRGNRNQPPKRIHQQRPDQRVIQPPDGKRRFDPNKKQRYDRGDISARTVAGMERPQRHAPKRIPGTTLVKALVSFQFASRRLSLIAIEQGRVKVNDETITEPNTHIKIDKDIISIDGMVLQRKSIKLMTAVFHKPHGLTGSREEYRLTLYSSLSNKRNWYFPSGVLPKAASGIVIVSNDRRHANHETTIIRSFTQDLYVKVHRRVNQDEINWLSELLRTQRPADEEILEVEKGLDNARSSWIKVKCKTVNFHDIAVALKSMHLEVLSMERRRLGPFSTDTLQPGAWYRLTDHEVVALDELASGNKPENTPLKEIWDEIAASLFEPRIAP